MNLDRTGREWLTFTTSDPDGGTLKVSFDGETWHDLVPTDPPVDTTARVLVAGPDATANPGSTVVLPVGTHQVFIKLTAGSEVIIRESPDHLTVG